MVTVLFIMVTVVIGDCGGNCDYFLNFLTSVIVQPIKFRFRIGRIQVGRQSVIEAVEAQSDRP